MFFFPLCLRRSCSPLASFPSGEASRDCKQAIIPAFVCAAGARSLQRAPINCLIPHLVRNGPLILKGHIDWFVFLPSACVCVRACGLCSVCSQSLSHSLPAAADIRPLSVNRTIDPVPLSTMEGQPGCCVEGSWSGTAGSPPRPAGGGWRRSEAARWPPSLNWVREVAINGSKCDRSAFEISGKLAAVSNSAWWRRCWRWVAQPEVKGKAATRER